MNQRRSIYLENFSHKNPIPVASRIGPFLFSGALTGRDLRTRDMPESLEEQCANIFTLVRLVLEAEGGSTDQIGKITFHLADYRDRAALNREWLDMFPDPAAMPARQVLAASLDGGALIHADLVAVFST
ncbi:RidA family protein [Paenarthrobacter sp. NPDC057981]|uniref:RidA family protein n=1 Tax=Paenarthrobacter sp. NPDC057981 TaxID=3346297 RepID=UPI0036DCCF84